MTTTPTIEPRTECGPASGGWSPGWSLDGLATLRFDALAELYAKAASATPETLQALEGSPAGRMLTLRGPLGSGPARGLVARWAASSRFPWGGKDFFAGGGINRIRLAGQRRWYPFVTRVEASALDGRPCVALDYDQPGNPGLIRRIRDELREVGPGLFLGPAILEVGGRQVTALWFAVQADARG